MCRDPLRTLPNSATVLRVFGRASWTVARECIRRTQHATCFYVVGDEKRQLQSVRLGHSVVEILFLAFTHASTRFYA